MIKKSELILPVLLLAVLLLMYLGYDYAVAILFSWMLAGLLNIAGGWYLFRNDSPKSVHWLATLSGFSFWVVYFAIGIKIMSLGYSFILGAFGLFCISLTFMLTMFHPNAGNADYSRFFHAIKWRHVLYSIALFVFTLIPDSLFLKLKYHDQPERLILEQNVLDNPLDTAARNSLNRYKESF